MSTFIARWGGICSACGDRFPAGAEVRYEGTDLVEVECSAPAPALDRSKLCGSCFTVHGPGQVECS